MNDLFNILIFSKDYNQGAIIQDYIKATGYNSQVFDQEKAAYEGLLSRKDRPWPHSCAEAGNGFVSL